MNNPLIEICDCESNYSIEPHGENYVLYFGRCNHRHGYNLAALSELSDNCELNEIERLLNRADVGRESEFTAPEIAHGLTK